MKPRWNATKNTTLLRYQTWYFFFHSEGIWPKPTRQVLLPYLHARTGTLLAEQHRDLGRKLSDFEKQRMSKQTNRQKKIKKQQPTNSNSSTLLMELDDLSDLTLCVQRWVSVHHNECVHVCVCVCCRWTFGVEEDAQRQWQIVIMLFKKNSLITRRRPRPLTISDQWVLELSIDIYIYIFYFYI